jgi:amino acid adenylation domain-containing protein
MYSFEQQQSVQARCFHPSGTFVEFKKEEIEQSIPDRFEALVHRHPEKTAVQDSNRTLTYRELDTAANHIAQAILDEGREREEPVALLFQHEVMMIASILGALKAGKIYVPLDLSYPKARLEYILQDSCGVLVVTDKGNLPLAEDLARNRSRTLSIDCPDGDRPGGWVRKAVPADNLIYILYTSGSTGTPKGVVQNHRHRLHDIMIHTNGLHICPEDRLALLYSCNTGMGTTVLFSALLNGASLHLYDLKERGIGGLAPWITRNGITIYTSISSVLRQFLASLNDDMRFPDLRVIYQSGEPLYRRDVEEYKKHFHHDCILINGMGAGETARLRRLYIDKKTKIPENVVPVGYAVDDKEILLLDETGRDMGCGQVGEIVVRSRYLSPGYWRKPELTEAVFTSRPEWGESRMYHTGDLGVISADGCLRHVGRKDFQVKIRGHRIEIHEVEAALCNLHQARDAAIVLHDDGEGQRDLVAHVVPETLSDRSASSLRRGLSEILPEHMIPSAFVFHESLPRLPNGKIDRKTLAGFDRTRRGAGRPPVSPRDAVEELLKVVWEKVLEVRPVGVKDNFFDLGGDSLRAMSLVLEIEKAFGNEISLATLFRSPTIEQLAQRFRQDSWTAPWISLVPLQPHGSKPPLFCVHGSGAYTLFYARMASLLDRDQPVYGLQARGLDGRHPPLESVEEMADRYIEEIRSVQPHGPYRLGGFCFGIYVVAEMAKRLEEQGEETALLVGFNPAGHERGALSFFGGLRRHLLRMAKMTMEEKIEYLEDRAGYRAGRLRDTVLDVIFTLFGRRYQALADKIRHVHIQEINRRAGRKYDPHHIQGRLLLFLGAREPYRNPEAYWRGLTRGEVEVQGIPGKRNEILQDPGVQLLAQKLQEKLDSALQDLKEK